MTIEGATVTTVSRDDLIARASKQLKVREGVRLQLYRDTKGLLSIGVGRNIQQVGIRPDESDLMLANDVADSIQFLSQYDWFTKLNEPRQVAILDMSFMGVERLLHFIHMIAALDHEQWDAAHAECINSEWFKDVGPIRGNAVATMLRTGEWDPAINC